MKSRLPAAGLSRGCMSTRVQRDKLIGGAHHVPDPQDDGSCADMAAQAAAWGVPAVPRGHRHLVCYKKLREHLATTSLFFPPLQSFSTVRLPLDSPLLITVSSLMVRAASVKLPVVNKHHFRFKIKHLIRIFIWTNLFFHLVAFYVRCMWWIKTFKNILYYIV